MQLTLFRYARRRPGDPALRTKKSQVQFWMSSHSPIYLDEFPKKSPHLGASAVKKSVAVRRVRGTIAPILMTPQKISISPHRGRGFHRRAAEIGFFFSTTSPILIPPRKLTPRLQRLRG